jgi:hypothetical protein
VSERRQTIESYLRANPRSFALVPDEDDRGAQIVEMSTGKILRFLWNDIAQVARKENPQRQAPYLVIVFADGRQIALADVGFAFAPSTRNTGPLADLPATFCFRDFGHLSAGAGAILSEEGREREALSAVMLGIALLDGARAVGLDVSREERELESLLRRLEERGARP